MTMPHRRQDDRMGGAKIVAGVIGTIIALGSLIWSAARIASSVDSLNGAVVDLKTTTSALQVTITGILVTQARFDAELQALKTKAP